MYFNLSAEVCQRNVWSSIEGMWSSGNFLENVFTYFDTYELNLKLTTCGNRKNKDEKSLKSTNTLVLKDQ